jgi:hypothetical protein
VFGKFKNDVVKGETNIMGEIYNDEEKEEMIELINDYEIEHDDCERSYCNECCFLEDCYYIARQKENNKWAELINYGGYDTEEEFWEQLLD